MRSWFILALLAVLAVPYLASAAALQGTTELPVAIEADQLGFDKATGTYSASGKVSLKRGDTTLQTEGLSWQTESGDIDATGGVRLERQEDILEGESLHFNLDSGLGVLEKGSVFVKERNFRLAGQTVERLGELDYRVYKGIFTTCEGDVPAWKFGARDLDVTLGRYARAKHVLFYLHDIPVLYLPYIIYPVKTERESGFLMPRFGQSDSKGFQLSLAYYKVLARNMDATIYLDLLTKMGVGKGLEYRYIFGDDNEGVFKGYHVDGLNGFSDRYALNWQHAGTLPGQVRMTADTEYVSDNDYFEDFGEVAGEYNKDQVESTLALNRQWDKAALTGLFKYIKDLESDNAQTLQRLPQIDFALLRQRHGKSPFYFALDSSSTYFWRRNGEKGERLTLRPEIAMISRPWGGLFSLEAGGGFLQRYYSTSDEGPGEKSEGIYDLFAHVGSRLDRVYGVDGKRVSRVRHRIEPEIDYLYIPNEDQQGLPLFDRLDRVEAKNRLRYALTNRLTARLESEGETEYHELLYLRLSQEYDIREARRDLAATGDKRRPSSDLRLEMVVRPTRRSFIDIDALYDVHEGGSSITDRFSAFHTRAGIRDDAGNALTLGSRYVENEVDYLSGIVDLSWLKPVYTTFEQRYHLGGDQSLERVIGVDYRAQCWSLALTFRDRPQVQEYFISFSLSGVGSVGTFGGSLRQSDQ